MFQADMFGASLHSPKMINKAENSNNNRIVKRLTIRLWIIFVPIVIPSWKEERAKNSAHRIVNPRIIIQKAGRRSKICFRKLTDN